MDVAKNALEISEKKKRLKTITDYKACNDHLMKKIQAKITANNAAKKTVGKSEEDTRKLFTVSFFPRFSEYSNFM